MTCPPSSCCSAIAPRRCRHRSLRGGREAHRALGAAPQGALRLRSGSRARGGGGLDRALGERRAHGSARRRAGDREGEHRLEGRADAARYGRDAADPGRAGCAPARTAARGRRDHLLQDHDAGLRHDLVGRIELPSAHAQSVGPVEEPRRIELRRGRGGRGRLRAAACRHRHRRLGAPARRLVRPGRPEAEPRAHPDRSALCGALRRPDDPHGRRHRADDVGAVQARPSRRHEPAGAGHRLDEPVRRPARQAHRPAARRRRRHAGRSGGEGGGRGGCEMLRRRGRDRRAGRAA